MKLVVGCPIKDRAWCLPEWFAAVESQGVEVEYLFVYSESSDETEALLKEHTDNILYDAAPGRSEQEVLGHIWGDMHRYEYMAQLRNGLMAEAYNLGADYFFSLDSDIILPPDGIKRLLQYAERHLGVIAPAVNMAWGMTAWNVMSWVDPEHPNRAERKIVPPVSGHHHVVMAAMLLDRHAMNYCRWVAHPQGEDIGFSVHAWGLQIPLWWVEEVRCQHLMRRS